MCYQMKMWNGISVTLRTTVGPSCDVIQSNFAFRVDVDLHRHTLHILVIIIIIIISAQSISDTEGEEKIS